MTESRLYCDANASDVLRPEARGAALEALACVGNPSSVHAEGRLARRQLEGAREIVASLLGVTTEGCVFTGGGTEANALAIHALGQDRRVLVGTTEHDAVRLARQDATPVPVLCDGTLDLDALEQALSNGPPALVCVMAANNETGVLHPLKAISALCRRHGARLHVDAVQAAGRMPFDLAQVDCDSAAISGHKMGGLKGAGAALFRGPFAVPGTFAAHVTGGGQERGRRGGTQALPAIASMAAALAAARAQDWSSIGQMRDGIDDAARKAGAVVAGSGAPRLANTTSLVLPGVAAQVQLMMLDLAGIAVSAGSACSSGKVSTSHVLEAMGFGAAAGQAIRVSLPWNAKPETASRLAEAYGAMAARLGKSPAGHSGVS
ncbi:cysteine desulfurase family protein [Tanticharoenia sakaeratensis]|uniref:Cysteine desulfurase n=1 Tax=Tanticharoenia sakaeratensis NBRC 103193 TaxID=1231623 RepID=A0A0D6MPK4_9PROT|nr:aminotransferase class V-fold PLP-dependent enzyme [Tanticharoenia sakaeratensis]GAN55629.1 cysteine desulfurase I NifS [Tanticharoenia sakaeratensis NBRC 103193]GBQ22794.1 cysteine desulfurase [Tanticharoenia sakaeratensis NBRC 103193]